MIGTKRGRKGNRGEPPLRPVKSPASAYPGSNPGPATTAPTSADMVTIRPRPRNPAAPASLRFPSRGRPADAAGLDGVRAGRAVGAHCAAGSVGMQGGAGAAIRGDRQRSQAFVGGLPRVLVWLDRPTVVQGPAVTIAGVDGVPALIPCLEPAAPHRSLGAVRWTLWGAETRIRVVTRHSSDF
jgi:hypothetical protein